MRKQAWLLLSVSLWLFFDPGWGVSPEAAPSRLRWPYLGQASAPPLDSLQQFLEENRLSGIGSTFQSAPIPTEIGIGYEGSTLWTLLTEVSVSGRYAYCSMLYGLLVLDISNPDNPTWVSQIYVPGGAGADIVVQGNRAYFADGIAGLQVIDITKPDSPSILGTINPWGTRTVDVSGNVAYISDHADWLYAVDVSDPRHPTIISTFSRPTS